MYKMKMRTNYIRGADAPYKSELPYTYEPDLDMDIIEGRLLMIVVLYAHMDMRGYARLTIQDMFEYAGITYNRTHWRESYGARIFNAGLMWLMDNGMVRACDDDKHTLFDYTPAQLMQFYINSDLFDMDLNGGKDFEPYFQLYQNDVEKIFAANDKYVRKLLHVYCYIKSCLPNRAPYAWCVPRQSIIECTGYTPVYISKALRVLCDDIGVLHRAPLSRTSDMQPPYVYIADSTNWKRYLQQKVDEENERRGGIPAKRIDAVARSFDMKSDPHSTLYEPVPDKDTLAAMCEYIKHNNLADDVPEKVISEAKQQTEDYVDYILDNVTFPFDQMDDADRANVQQLIIARRKIEGNI